LKLIALIIISGDIEFENIEESPIPLHGNNIDLEIE